MHVDALIQLAARRTERSSHFAFIGMTKKSRMIRFGKIIANAESSP
jgi:hypothetical protein